MAVRTASPPTATGAQLRSPVLVGRDRELARVAAAVSTPPAVVVVEGESGIGKTRFVSELPGHPALAGHRFASGWCRRIREPFPLAPVLDAVRSCVADWAAGELSPVVGALRPWLPELADRLPPSPAPLEDRSAERHRAFRALVEVLASLGPVALVIEDMHWADEQTLDFVSYLLWDPPAQLTLVVTFRSEDVAPAVRALTAKLPAPVARADAVLAPLDAGQTGALAAAALGVDRVPEEFADDLYARTSGSPFAVEELLGLLQARGRVTVGNGLERAAVAELAVPAGIRDLVLERAGRLSDSARSVVDAAAVLQDPAQVAVLASVCGASKPHTVQGVDEALAVGLLVEHEVGVGFRHLLAAQAVYGQLSGPRREQLHERAAAALLAADPAALGPAAHHLRHSGDLAAWADAAETAADRAIELGHDDEAARLLDDVLRHAPLDATRRGGLAVKLARSALEALQEQDAGVLSQELDADLPPAVRGELRFLIAVLLDRSRQDPLWQRQLCGEAVPELADRPVLQAWAMVGMGIPIGCGVPAAEHLRWLERSLATVTDANEADPEAGASGLKVGVLGKVAMALLLLGDGSWRRAQQRLLASAPGPPRGRREVIAYYSVASAATAVGHHQASDRLLTRALAGARGHENPQVERTLVAERAVLDYHVGAWQGLRERLDRQREWPHPFGAHCTLATARGGLALAHGDLDDAHRLLSWALDHLEQGSEFWDTASAAGTLIRLAISRGDLEQALGIVARLRTALESKQLWAAMSRALPEMVRAQVRADTIGEARRLVTSAEAELAGLDLPLAPAALRFAQGILDAADHRWADAGRHLLAAADQYDALWCPYEAAQAREEAAAALFTTDAGAGTEALLAAVAAYQRLEASWDLNRARNLARRHEVSVPAQHRGGRLGYGEQPSPREREVVALAAIGRSNAEIAEELFLSTSTVKKHLTAAMRKLGVRSRAALAHRWASDPEALASKDGPAGL